MMCQAAWLKILESLLNQIAFSSSESCTTNLVECSACFIQFRRYTQCDDMSDFSQYADALWGDFIQRRNVYLKSTGLLKDCRLPQLQHLIKTSFIVPL